MSATDHTAAGDPAGPGEGSTPPQPSRRRALLHELAKFGSVGAVAYVVDTGLYNLLVHGPGNLLGAKPVTAKVISVAVSIIVAWIGNRYWTFAGKRNQAAGRELLAFIVVNVGGLAIASGCLYFSRYALHLDSALADNISGNVIGTGLGTIFRYLTYKFFIFRGDKVAALEATVSDAVPEAGSAPQPSALPPHGSSDSGPPAGK